MDKFKAIVVREENDKVTYGLEEVGLEDLSEGEVLIDVEYSTVNYKDMLAVQKNGGVIREYPMIPGIDIAGKVVSSDDPEFKEDDLVIAGWDAPGVSTTGGYAEYARVASKYVIHAPENISSKELMTYGTAGYTAALSILSLEEHGMNPEDDPEILVTGSTGGVGSVAVRILEKAGYKNINALVRKDYQIDVAKSLGATNIVQADDLNEGRTTLDSRNYHYVLDTVGGDVAAKALAQIYENGSMSMCGNAGGHEFNATVLPMILRGVNILGINAVDNPKELRTSIWEKLANEWYVADKLVTDEVSLEELEETIEAIKNGKHLGRTIVRI
jgi:putative YhdH/YhfP family quinone oxidoreductase